MTDLTAPGASPTDLAVERAVDLLATIAHPVRLSVLSRLHRHGPACVSDLVEVLGVEQSAMSHHLRHLREARLVHGERQGKRIVYRLQDEHVGCIVEDAIAHAAEHVAPDDEAEER
jgi:DNA-binding transcriptional ArsR family regulator